MWLLNVVQQLWQSDDLHEIATQTADRCSSDIWERVSRRLTTMDVDEARGYIRSRAALLVARELSENPLCKRLSDHQQHQLKQLALDISIDIALVRKQTLVIQPMVVRRAA